MKRTMTIVRLAAALLALGFLALPVAFPQGWAPVALSAWGFALCAGTAVFGLGD